MGETTESTQEAGAADGTETFTAEQVAAIKADYEARDEKRSSHIRDLTSQRDQLEHGTKKLISTLEGEGIAEVDEKYNLTIKAKAQEQKDAISQIDSEIDKLDRMYDSNDIDDKEYSKRVAALNADKAEVRAVRRIREENEAKTKAQAEVSTYNGFMTKIASFKGISDTNSPLYRKMTEIYQSSPDDYSLGKNAKGEYTDPRDWIHLANQASRELGMKPEATTVAQDNMHQTLESSSGQVDTAVDDEFVSAAEKKTLTVKMGFKDNTVKRIDKSLANQRAKGHVRGEYGEIGTWRLEG